MIRIPYILVDTSARLGVEMEYNFFFFFARNECMV